MDPTKTILPQHISNTVEHLISCDAKKATTYVDGKTVVTATRRHKPDKRAKSIELVLKLGAPNFREREFIAACIKSGEPFPVKKVQLKFFQKDNRKK